MVGGGPQVLEQQQQSLPQPLSAANEEAVKRNTDCVYFLASPLTCKKVSFLLLRFCLIRHSFALLSLNFLVAFALSFFL